ncbi:MAG: Ribonuclease R, partial [Deltaproteobacteria bacterium]|nr:Ribonuclease R [Deltaproteobacteria bacterium]
MLRTTMTRHADSQTQQKILELFAKHPSTRLTPAEIQRRAGFERNDLQLIIDALRELCREGKLVRLKKHHYSLPDRQNLVTGRVHAHPDGYGFLIPEDKNIEDVYLSRREMRRVMHGDQLMVRIDRKPRGATEAHIVQVIGRAQKRLLGTYEEIDGKAYLIPMDARIGAMPLKIAGARLEKGKVVAAEISRFGTAMSPPEAAMVQVMGDPDDPEVQAQSIIFRFGLSPRFPPEVHREVMSAAYEISESEIARREDLRALPIVTIDGENARDFDDAVYVRRNGQAYELFVSIADVSYYVRPETALDQEAYARATSVYFPDRAIPMLPEALSNGICSLNPAEDRLTKTAWIAFNGNGEATGSRFFDSIIRSHARMTYTEVRRILVDKDSECLVRHAPLVDQFKLMEELAL